MTGFLWASLVVDVCNRTLLFADSQPRFKETLHIYVTLCSLSQRCSSQKRIKTGYKDALIGPRMPSPARVSLQKGFKLISNESPSHYKLQIVCSSLEELQNANDILCWMFQLPQHIYNYTMTMKMRFILDVSTTST